MLKRLVDGEVHLWHATAAKVRSCDAKALRFLSPDEVKRAADFVFAKDRELFLLGRVLLRTALSTYVAVPANEWRFIMDEHGKPEVDRPESERSLRFNLSHTDGFLACAVTWLRPVGVDVESMHREVDWEPIAKRFAPEEYQQIVAKPPDQQRETFFALWTLKEAYSKACGRGLTVGLDASRFVLAERGGVKVADVGPTDSEWSFFCPSLSPNHRAAVAVEHSRGSQVRLVVREM